ncbi:DEAD/DEAH box helicase family protein [endosymbiont GvMRE of Glomus versiforme]|uniref:DEAD/DEAH box helicase family protein n=1 Tax=endosymbiont GvMRE of Glomus versiforme TaxID=2039283 RepID=UPI000EC9FFF6|nr:DEAD/DEAH box helicase family protein [endosymbiont GvMRE of Glomus versiforme]RHZ36637.1 Type III restriction enzyme [endosymbiont GvMRE of Glomus versiforme]
MNENKCLHERVKGYVGEENWENIPIPKIVKNNLNPKFKSRPYQEEAFRYFINYWEKEFRNKDKHQLLFLMATGSGKTLMMAGLILYLYEKGYRNFLFFVNSRNIIDKTRDNFLNDTSIKYLFNNPLSRDDKKILLQEVDNFQTTDNDNINICFETIQGLHSRLNTPQENSLTFEDFQDQKIALISDEAHHINVETKIGSKLSKEEREELNSWENTVNKIFAANSQNVLLEFTATIDKNNPNIWNKYAPRLIFDYPLKQFRQEGYSKEVKVLQTDAEPFDRALQAVLLSQYRRKIFEKNGKVIKPVILFKSKTISKSEEFQNEFIKGIATLTSDKLKEIEANAKDEFLKVFKYLAKNKISLDNFIIELKEDFSAEKTISVNSQNESEKNQLAVNTLEDPNNEYRAIFAVDKLNEGWDVLNLFDIVRLYDTRDAKNNIPGPTTIKEAQLIGRGARYCPFKINDTDEPSKRKLDHDLQNEMRICEELYYHSNYNPRYIQELTSALIKTGIIPDNTFKRKLVIKNDFKNTELYNSGLLFLNQREKYSRNDVIELPSSIRDYPYETSLRTNINLSKDLFKNQFKESIEKKEEDFWIKDLKLQTVKKALYKFDFYSFSNLKKWFPNLEKLEEFIKNEKYLGGVKITVSGLASQLKELKPEDEIDILTKIIGQIASSLASNSPEFRGSKEFKYILLKEKIDDKELNFALNESWDKELGKSMKNNQETKNPLNLDNRPWYVFNDCYGTSEEKHFIKYIDRIYNKLQEKYDEIYLIRNERFFKLYNFEDGKALEPDYVLFLRQKASSKNLHYQVFIEPKGSHFKKKDAWKEEFLISLKKEHKIEKLWEDREHKIWGMPFYNKSEETDFDQKFNKEVF